MNSSRCSADPGGTRAQETSFTTCFLETDRGLTLFLKVSPRAARDGIDGPEPVPDTGPSPASHRLKVRVRAVPDKGAANTAVIALLAKALRLPKSDVSIVSGTTDRSKTVQLAGAPADLAARLAALLEDLS